MTKKLANFGRIAMIGLAGLALAVGGDSAAQNGFSQNYQGVQKTRAVKRYFEPTGITLLPVANDEEYDGLRLSAGDFNTGEVGTAGNYGESRIVDDSKITRHLAGYALETAVRRYDSGGRVVYTPTTSDWDGIFRIEAIGNEILMNGYFDVVSVYSPDDKRRVDFVQEGGFGGTGNEGIVRNVIYWEETGQGQEMKIKEVEDLGNEDGIERQRKISRKVKDMLLSAIGQ